MKHLSLLFIVLLALACSCSRPAGSQAETEAAAESFQPVAGMKLSSLADLPGVQWSFDTVRGVCAPDTLLLWMDFDGRAYVTNVYGYDDAFELLSESGVEKIRAHQPASTLTRADFGAEAAISRVGAIDRSAYRARIDSLYAQRVDSMLSSARRFFLSAGDIKYMGRRMASNWQLIYAQNEKVDDGQANPFNGGSSFEFETESLTVELSDPTAGVVEVSAFCWDPYTVGRPGWAYWTVNMTLEGGRFLVAETPLQHRRFSN